MNFEKPKNSILNFDIFKNPTVKDRQVPDYSLKFIVKLKASLLKIRDDTLEKYIPQNEVVRNDVVPKVMVELERSLNTMMQRSMESIKSTENIKQIRLGDLYRASNGREGVALRRQLESVYLASRVYKQLFRDNPFVDNLQLRLISVRCRAIRDFCQNESRRGKIRHLRCSKNAKLILSLPKKLRSIIKKINRELHKCVVGESGSINEDKLKEFHRLLTRGDGNDDDGDATGAGLDLLEEVIGGYYRHVEGDSPRTEELVEGLGELCRSQNKAGEWQLLHQCDQDAVLERLKVSGAEVERDFCRWDRSLWEPDREPALKKPRKAKEEPKSRVEERVEVPKSREKSPDKEEMDILDFENFQLVDVWEEKAEETVPVCEQPRSETKTVDKDQKKESRSSRRKRTSRFAPLTDEDLVLFQQQQLEQMQFLQPRTLGFCSTFVDEDPAGDEDKPGRGGTVQERRLVEASQAKAKEPPVEEAVAVPQEAPERPAEKKESLDRGELCKTMLRKFHDSLKLAIEEAALRPAGDWNQSVSTVMQPWRVPGDRSCDRKFQSAAAAEASREIFRDIEGKMGVLVRDFLNRPQARRKSIRPAVVEREVSASPTPFDQTIEASLKKPRGNAPSATHPVVARRPTRSEGHSSSPERTRLRAMMLSYKRDVEKSREFSGDKKDESGHQDSEDFVTEPRPKSPAAMSESTLKPLTTTIESLDTAPVHVSMPKKEPKEDKSKFKAHESDSEGLVSSSDEEQEPRLVKEKKAAEVAPGFVKETRAEKNRMQWLVPPPETVPSAPIPAPATPFLDDEGQSWAGRKVFVVDSHDKGSSIALMVKSFLQKNGARVYDTSNYKQAGKDLHVLVHQDWRFPDSSSATTRVDNTPITLLLLKNNSGVHFLSYTDVENVSRFSCQTVFPHGRSCIFLDHHALTGTHADNVRNMLDFMISERKSSNRIWCLKIPCSVYKLFSMKISGNTNEVEVANLKEIQSILMKYSTEFTEEGSMCLVEIQTGDEDVKLQEHVLNQQYYLQKKFRHFCILTDNLNTTELDMMFLSLYGVAVLSLNTFLINKTGQFIKNIK